MCSSRRAATVFTGLPRSRVASAALPGTVQGSNVRHAFENARDRISRLRALCFVDLDDDYRRSILISSSGRSGSTWLAEMVNYRNEYRFIFEPFRRDLSKAARSIPYGLYLEPGSEPPIQTRAAEAILRGRVRNAWSHGHNRRRIANRRIVKEIRVTNLMPWIHERLPELPIVYLLRHPVSVAESWTRLGWRDFLGEFTRQELLMERMSGFRPLIDEITRAGSPFERHLLRWCLENFVPLSDLQPGDAHVVFHEHLMAEPESELRRLFAYLGKDFEPSVLERIHEPSAVSYPGPPPGPLSDANRAWASEIVRAFGLDHVYGPEREPRVGPGSTVEMLPR